jgi:(2Fe-2S) ferredoxin
MEKPEHHIFVCASFRTDGSPKGRCHKGRAVDLLSYIENEIIDRGMDALVTGTGCMKACEHGPVLIVYPDNVWYGGVESEAIVDEILDAIEDGKTAPDYLID